MRKKILVLSLVILTLTFALVGCSPQVRLSDVYVNHSEITKFDDARLEGVLPKGFEVAYNFSDYNKQESPFFHNHKWVVIRKGKSNTKLAVYDYGADCFIVGSETELVGKIKKNEQYIIYTPDTSSNIMLRPANSIDVVNLTEKFNITTTSAITVPSQNSKYFTYTNRSNIIEIYDTVGYITKIQVEVEGVGYCSNVVIYDDYLVQMDEIQDARGVAIYKIPEERDTGSSYSILKPMKTFSSSNVYPSYLGNGKFYIFSQDLEYNDNYEYILSSNKYVAKYVIYDASKNEVGKESKDTKYYKSITSNENEMMTNDYGDLKLSIEDIIQDGYMFATGINYDSTTKIAQTDQFIMDQNLDVKVSLSGKYGKDIKLNKDRIAGISPLMMVFIDGKGFSPEMNISGIRLINIDGTTAFEKADGLYQSLFYNNDALVCQKLVDNTLYNPFRYGAFDMNGKEIISFNYDYMTPFIDGYSLAYNEYVVLKDNENKPIETDIRVSDLKKNSKGKYVKPDGEVLPDSFTPTKDVKKVVYRVDKNGNKITIEDIAITKTNKLVFKVGAYVAKSPQGGYVIKNLSGEEIFDSKFDDVFEDVVIDRPNLDDVTICGTKGDQVYIYTLVSSSRGVPVARTIHDVVIPAVIIGSLFLATVVLLAVIKVKNIQPITNEGSVKEEEKKEEKPEKVNKKKKK